MLKFAVLGSCVSADPFYERNLGSHVAYFSGRSSMCTRALPSIKYSLRDGYEDCGASAFSIKEVLEEFEKNTLLKAAKAKPDYVVIDMVFEAGDILLTEDSAVLETYPLNQLLPFLDTEPFVRKISGEERKEYWDSKIDATISQLHALDLADRVIIHYCLLGEQQRLADGSIVAMPELSLHHTRKHNGHLAHYYSSLQKLLPNALTLGPYSDLLVCDPTHRWGLSNSHYIPEYYQCFLASLLSLPITARSLVE